MSCDLQFHSLGYLSILNVTLTTVSECKWSQSLFFLASWWHRPPGWCIVGNILETYLSGDHKCQLANSGGELRAAPVKLSFLDAGIIIDRPSSESVLSPQSAEPWTEAPPPQGFMATHTIKEGGRPSQEIAGSFAYYNYVCMHRRSF